MANRKLQIFVSSTYEDLIDHRLAAMETILAAGHIPAAMEQFSPGEETALEKIEHWIDESDAFVLILGGRYGSIEPKSGKSYVELEYDYAVEKQKPFFTLVVAEAHHEERVKKYGLRVHEQDHAALYKQFREKVTIRLCKFWGKSEDIQIAIFQKLPEWAQREDLKGWVRAEEAVDPRVAGELARLSQENSDLRLRVESSTESAEFEGLSFDQMVAQLAQPWRFGDLDPWDIDGTTSQSWFENTAVEESQSDGRLTNVGLLLEFWGTRLAGAEGLRIASREIVTEVLDSLVEIGLVALDPVDDAYSIAHLTQMGRRFRNRLLLIGNLRERLDTLWNQEVTEGEHEPSQ